MSGAIASTLNPHLGVMIPSALGFVVIVAIYALSPELREGRYTFLSDDLEPEPPDRIIVSGQSSD